jgi:hypothetical protein
VSHSLESAVYLYCIVRATRRPRVTGAPAGVPRATPPTLLDLRQSLWLVTSDVPLDVYGPETLEPRLRDLDWVASVAVAHEAVTEFFARRRGTTVVPMKLLTMFSSADKAAGDVRGRRAAIRQTMQHIAGCEEWGIRVTRRPAAATEKRHSRQRTGAGFLQARKTARDAEASARVDAAAAADASFACLTRHARDAHRRERGREPGTNPPVLDAAFLVRAGARGRFKAETRRQSRALAAAGADLTLTGPWPAYNFVNADV